VHRDRFNQCPCCHAWLSVQDILESPLVEPLGMAFDQGDPGYNLLYFNHLVEGCGSTFTIEARRFAPFLPEEPPPEVKSDTPGCEHHCTSMRNLVACQASCHWAPFRRFMLLLRARRGLSAGGW
jgi:hypothetical protein